MLSVVSRILQKKKKNSVHDNIYTYTHLYIYCMQLQMYVYKTVIMRTVIPDNLVYFFQGFEKDKCYIASQGNYS